MRHLWHARPTRVRCKARALIRQQDLVSMHYKTHVPARFSVEDQMSEVASTARAQDGDAWTDVLALCWTRRCRR